MLLRFFHSVRIPSWTQPVNVTKGGLKNPSCGTVPFRALRLAGNFWNRAG
jgi:hypothetical protein